MKKIFISIILSLVLIPFSGAFAQESESGGVSVNPSVIEITSDKGGEVASYFVYENKTDQDRIIELEISPYLLSEGDKGSAVFYHKNGKKVDSISKEWISISDLESNVIRSGEKKEVEFVVKIPRDADCGKYYNAIFVKSTLKDTSIYEKSGNVIDYRIGVLTIVNVKSSIYQYLDILKDPTLSYYLLTIGTLLIVFVVLLIILKNKRPTLSSNKKTKK